MVLYGTISVQFGIGTVLAQNLLFSKSLLSNSVTSFIISKVIRYGTCRFILFKYMNFILMTQMSQSLSWLLAGNFFLFLNLCL